MDGSYTCSGRRSAQGFDSTIVRIDTDAGLTGWGEFAPLGSCYDPAFVDGARAGLRLLAPLLISVDPCALVSVNRRMDLHLNRHPYVKSALDITCNDIAANAAWRPAQAREFLRATRARLRLRATLRHLRREPQRRFGV